MLSIVFLGHGGSWYDERGGNTFLNEFTSHPQHFHQYYQGYSNNHQQNIWRKFLCFGMGDNIENGVHLVLTRSGYSESSTSYNIAFTGTLSSLMLTLSPPPFRSSVLSECRGGGEKRHGISPL